MVQIYVEVFPSLHISEKLIAKQRGQLDRIVE